MFHKPSAQATTPMQQHDLTNIPQIKVRFSHKIPFEKRPHISNSQDAIKAFLEYWDKDLMNVQKEMYILYLDQHRRAIGLYHHSKGGIQDCLGELQQVFAVGLQANAAYFAIAINDTAGNHEPSEAEIAAAQHVQQTARAIGLQLYDYLLLTDSKSVSFKDNYLLLGVSIQKAKPSHFFRVSFSKVWRVLARVE